MAYSNRAQLDMLAADADSAVKWAQRTLQLAEQAGYDEISATLSTISAPRDSSLATMPDGMI